MAPKKTARRRMKEEECIMNCLPRELIEGVFIRLPASCLLRCVSACQMWREIIRDSHFVAAHLQHASSCTLLFSPHGSILGTLYPSDAILFDEACSPSTWAVPVVGPDDLVCGSCNGLLCLYTPTSTIKIANPATGECMHLLKPIKSVKNDHFSFYRFGFHPATKEYKVIRFFQDCNNNIGDRFNVIQVYTLGDEKWKDVVTSNALSLNCVKNSGVVIVDGTMYWLNENRGTSWQHVVMSFDICGESFAQIQLPEFVLEDCAFAGPRHYWIIEIDGKVCVSTAQSISHVDRFFLGKLQIWTLNKKVDQRWSQEYNIQLSSLFIRGLHFVHGDKILIHGCDSNLYSYELLGKNSEIELSKMVKLLDLSSRGEDDMQFYVFLKSLVPLDAYVKAAIVRRPKRREWRLKKWKVWEHELSKIKNLWSSIHHLECEVLELRQFLGMRAKEFSQCLPDVVIQQRISMEIDQILQRLSDCPDQHPWPLRRPNWVKIMQHMDALEARMDGLRDMVKAFRQALRDTTRILESYATACCQCKQQAQ